MASTSPRRGGSGLPNGVNGYAYSTGSTNSNRASWSGSQSSSTSRIDDDDAYPPRYPHIKDLQAKAQADESVSINSSVRLLSVTVYYGFVTTKTLDLFSPLSRYCRLLSRILRMFIQYSD